MKLFVETYLGLWVDEWRRCLDYSYHITADSAVLIADHLTALPSSTGLTSSSRLALIKKQKEKKMNFKDPMPWQLWSSWLLW